MDTMQQRKHKRKEETTLDAYYFLCAFSLDFFCSQLVWVVWWGCGELCPHRGSLCTTHEWFSEQQFASLNRYDYLQGK